MVNPNKKIKKVGKAADKKRGVRSTKKGRSKSPKKKAGAKRPANDEDDYSP